MHCLHTCCRKKRTKYGLYVYWEWQFERYAFVNEWLALKRAVVVIEVVDYFFCFFVESFMEICFPKLPLPLLVCDEECTRLTPWFCSVISGWSWTGMIIGSVVIFNTHSFSIFLLKWCSIFSILDWSTHNSFCKFISCFTMLRLSVVSSCRIAVRSLWFSQALYCWYSCCWYCCCCGCCCCVEYCGVEYCGVEYCCCCVGWNVGVYSCCMMFAELAAIVKRSVKSLAIASRRMKQSAENY